MGVWGKQIQTVIFILDKQQNPTVQHRGLGRRLNILMVILIMFAVILLMHRMLVIRLVLMMAIVIFLVLQIKNGLNVLMVFVNPVLVK